MARIEMPTFKSGNRPRGCLVFSKKLVRFVHGIFNRASGARNYGKVMADSLRSASQAGATVFRLEHGAERIEHRPIIIDEDDPGFAHGGEWQPPARAGAPAGPMCFGIKRAPWLCEPEPFCRAARSRSWSLRAACCGGRSSRWRAPRLQLGGCSRLAVLDKPRRGAPKVAIRFSCPTNCVRTLFSRG